MSGNPDLEARLGRAQQLHLAGQLEAAEALYREVLALDGRHPQALTLLGVCQYTRGEYEAALDNMDLALGIEPGMFQAHYNRGLVLKGLARMDEAVISFDVAIRLHPGFAAAYCNKANVLKSLNRLDEALASYDRAIALDGRLAEAYNNRGAIFQMRGDFDAALRNYTTALELRPDYAQALSNRGVVLSSLQQFSRSIADLERALRLGPLPDYTLGYWLQAKRILCDWRDLDTATARTLEGVERGEKAAMPFVIVAAPSTPAQQMRAARIYARDKYPAGPESVWRGPTYRHERIRVGYFSNDYHEHATSYLIAELIERHDRQRFEIFGFSLGPDKQDAMRARMARAFDAFHDVRAQGDDEIARLARHLEVDIAVDLKGYTFEARTGIFARRAAPIQVNYLGYPGTMAADYMDYLVGDAVVIPREQRPYYTERIVYMPHCYQANDSTKRIADDTRSRADHGLPREGFVFCSFNNSYKITPDVFDIWMRLLARTPGSVLWLMESTPEMVPHLRGEAVKRGIEPERLVFAKHAPLTEHLARYRHADLFLDTLYYNAHTTASDALWAGLPVLTRPGETFASRVAASLLTAVGMTELITHSLPAYEAVALELAHDAARLSALKSKLMANRGTQPLFDACLFAKHLEQAYEQMWRRQQDGLPPADIHVEPASQVSGSN